MIVNPLYWRYNVFSITGEVHVTLMQNHGKIILKIYIVINVVNIYRKNAFNEYLYEKWVKYTIM